MKNNHPLPDYSQAHRHLARRDAVLRRLIRELGPCTLRSDPAGFGVLCRSIISQQISSKAAISISARVMEAIHKRRLTPAAIAATSDAALRAAGLSASKLRSLRDLSEHVLDGRLPLRKLPDMPDDEVIAHLLPVHGIGPWTAEMFLIFSLGRLDVLPLGDLGLRAGIQRQYELAEIPDKEGLMARAEPWRPYRTIATWFFWRSFGNVPQSY